MEQFVTTIRELSCEYVVTMDNIRLGKTKAPKYEQRLPFVFPKDYWVAWITVPLQLVLLVV